MLWQALETSFLTSSLARPAILFQWLLAFVLGKVVTESHSSATAAAFLQGLATKSESNLCYGHLR